MPWLCLLPRGQLSCHRRRRVLLTEEPAPCLWLTGHAGSAEVAAMLVQEWAPKGNKPRASLGEQDKRPFLLAVSSSCPIQWSPHLTSRLCCVFPLLLPPNPRAREGPDFPLFLHRHSIRLSQSPGPSALQKQSTSWTSSAGVRLPPQRTLSSTGSPLSTPHLHVQLLPQSLHLAVKKKKNLHLTTVNTRTMPSVPTPVMSWWIPQPSTPLPRSKT